MDIAPATHLPASLPSTRQTPEVLELVRLLSPWQSVHGFHFSAADIEGGVVFVLVGRSGDKWLGLIGIGVLYE